MHFVRVDLSEYRLLFLATSVQQLIKPILGRSAKGKSRVEDSYNDLSLFRVTQRRNFTSLLLGAGNGLLIARFLLFVWARHIGLAWFSFLFLCF